MNFEQLTLVVMDEAFAICRLASNATLPIWATAGGFFSITRTADELSIMCRQDDVPEGVQREVVGAVCEWRGLCRFRSSAFSPR
jgi:hypothetical protein